MNSTKLKDWVQEKLSELCTGECMFNTKVINGCHIGIESDRLVLGELSMTFKNRCGNLTEKVWDFKDPLKCVADFDNTDKRVIYNVKIEQPEGFFLQGDICWDCTAERLTEVMNGSIALFNVELSKLKEKGCEIVFE